VDAVVRRRATERQVMSSGLSSPQEAVDVVVEFRAGWIWSAEIRKGVGRRKGADQHAAWTPDALQLRLGPSALQAEAVAVLETTACPATLGGDDDGAVGGIDTVQSRRFGSFQHGQALDILRIQV